MGNLTKETDPHGTTTYTYNAQNRMVLGVKSDGQQSAYVYNALGVRIQNVQIRKNQNAGYASADLKDGSDGVDYGDYLKDGRFVSQRVWETEVGTTVQNDFEAVTKRYTIDYLSLANRDIMVTEEGSWVQRYVYDEKGARISAEFDYAEGTHRGEGGENFASDIAAGDIQKVWYRANYFGSSLIAADENCYVISHPLTTALDNHLKKWTVPSCYATGAEQATHTIPLGGALMPSSPNQKLKLLYLMKIFLEQTDEQNPLTVQELIDALAGYGIMAERKSIYSDIELLRGFGIDIERRQSKTFSYFVASRRFELPELKLLVDAVQSSRFITHKKSEELIKKLASLTSAAQAKQLRRQVFVAGRPKTMNENIYYSIDAIHLAINENRRIAFRYFDYDIKMNRVYRRGGETYCQTPLALCWNDDNYYLISYNIKHEGLVHYRVDRMSDVTASEEPDDAVDRAKFNVAEYVKKVFGMFGGEMVRATLSFDNSLVNVVLDKFGKELHMTDRGSCFEVTVEVAQSPVLLAWLFQFGDLAEIKAPERLRDAMRALVTQSVKKYFPSDS